MIKMQAASFNAVQETQRQQAIVQELEAKNQQLVDELRGARREGEGAKWQHVIDGGKGQDRPRKGHRQEQQAEGEWASTNGDLRADLAAARRRTHELEQALQRRGTKQKSEVQRARQQLEMMKAQKVGLAKAAQAAVASAREEVARQKGRAEAVEAELIKKQEEVTYLEAELQAMEFESANQPTNQPTNPSYQPANPSSPDGPVMAPAVVHGAVQSPTVPAHPPDFTAVRGQSQLNVSISPLHVVGVGIGPKSDGAGGSPHSSSRLEAMQSEILKLRDKIVRLQEWKAEATMTLAGAHTSADRRRGELLKQKQQEKQGGAERAAGGAGGAQGMQNQMLSVLYTKTHVLKGAIASLTRLVDRQLQGERPSIDLLLDTGTDQLQSVEVHGDESGEMALAIMDGIEDELTALRNRISDWYAESIGENCAMQ
jgi:hypothetical protein